MVAQWNTVLISYWPAQIDSQIFTQLYLSVSFLGGSYMSISESWETPPNNCRVSALHLFGFRCWNKSLKTIWLSRRVLHLVDGLHIWYDVLQKQALSSSCYRLISLSPVSLTFQPILHEQKSLSMCSFYVYICPAYTWSFFLKQATKESSKIVCASLGQQELMEFPAKYSEEITIWHPDNHPLRLSNVCMWMDTFLNVRRQSRRICV